MRHNILFLLPFVFAAACDSSVEPSSTSTGTGTSTTTGTGSGTTSSSSGGGQCTLTANTSDSGVTSPDGCPVLDRDTSSCEAARKAAGLSGFWLSFSCRVSLSVSTSGGVTMVEAKSDGLPDYESNYFPTSDPCHASYSGSIQNPNTIATGSFDVTFPMQTSGASQKMMGAVVGLALNGVPIFGDFAAPGDDIYKEAETFDQCGGHPQNTGMYHYHSEPYSLTYDDDRLAGVMRDGSPIYGRHDPDGTIPTDLDAAGGHTGVTKDSPSTPVYHYHVNLQTSTNPQSAGQMAWFLTTGTYHSAPGSCTGCM
jgi:hypothetical protein